MRILLACLQKTPRFPNQQHIHDFLSEINATAEAASELLDKLLDELRDQSNTVLKRTESVSFLVVLIEAQVPTIHNILETLAGECIDLLTFFSQQAACSQDNAALSLMNASMNAIRYEQLYLGFVQHIDLRRSSELLARLNWREDITIASRLAKRVTIIQLINFSMPQLLSEENKPLLGKWSIFKHLIENTNVICILLDVMFDVIKSYKALFGLHGSLLRLEADLYLTIMLKDADHNLYFLEHMYREKRSEVYKHALETWKAITRDLQLGLNSPLRNLLERSICPPVWKACHWKVCICYEMNPCHPMKVCKGCWRVRYCSFACQQK